MARRWMRSVELWALALLAMLAGAVEPASAQGASARSANVTVTLLSEVSAVAPGQTFHVALRQEMAPGWHTYWRNPGDSGDATRIDWSLSEGATAGPILWPTPEALPFGPLVNYGYSGAVTLPVAVTVPDTAQTGGVLTLTASASWLECADVCIPGEGVVALNLPIADSARASPEAQIIQTTLAGLPKPFSGEARLTRGQSELQLSVTGEGLSGTRSAYFFAHEIARGALVDFPKPQKFSAGPAGISLSLAASPSLPKALPETISGVLTLGEGTKAKAFEVTASVGPPLPGASGAAPAAGVELGLAQAALFALLGGLILNLMPCVFPILSMKALSLAKAAHGNTANARRDGLLYGAGVMVTFLALGGILAALTAAGQASGWGFQLQSPAVLVALTALMVLIGLNLLGVFEIGGSVQGLGGNLAGRSDGLGAFLTGVLAVVVAAPCTAPFMGAALGYAATQPPAVALAVFAALALGFAAPFVALAFSPGLMRMLPKPGPWMARFKEAMAFPMLATAVWLVWVLAAQAGQSGVLAGLVAALAAGFAAWIARVARGSVARVLAAVIVLAACGWSLSLVRSQPEQANRAGSLRAEPWTPARVAELQAEGRTVLVNFTADWCVTCKVNEAVVFSNPDVAQAFERAGAAYLIADWTSRDSTIAAALSSHGRIGVPLYLLYAPGQTAPTVLPQVLTPGAVVSAVSRR